MPRLPDPPPDRGSDGRGRRRVPLVLVIVLALVVGAIGAVAGAYTAYRFDRPIAFEPVKPDDEFGSDISAFEKPGNVAEVADAVVPGVVHIKVAGSDGRATGSGFVISKDGYILTNNHVVAMAADSGSITVAFENGEEVSAEIVGRSPSYDLAVIEIDPPKGLEPVALGDSDDLVVGEPVVAVGAPLGLHGTVTTGIVSAKNRAVSAGGGGGSESSFINAIQTDAAINPGNSGGPLVNMKAEVVGVNSAIATLSVDEGPFGDGGGVTQGSIGLGFSIPINQARRTAQQLIEDGRAVYPVVGATIDGRHNGQGARLASVVPGGGADSAGLREGDLITAIGGTRVTGGDDLIVKIRSREPGDRITIDFRRDGEDLRVNVTLDEQVDGG